MLARFKRTMQAFVVFMLFPLCSEAERLDAHAVEQGVAVGSQGHQVSLWL